MGSNNEPQGGSKRKGLENEIKKKILIVASSTAGIVVFVGKNIKKNLTKPDPTIVDILKNTFKAITKKK